MFPGFSVRDAIGGVCFVFLIAVSYLTAIRPEGFPVSGKGVVTVEEVIGMTRMTSRLDARSFSPDGNRLIVVLTKGDLKTNTNVSSLFVLDIRPGPRPSPPRCLVSFRSSSNRDPISSPSWRGNETILFLGENSEELTQLYSVHYRSGKLRQLTHHPTSVTAYSSPASSSRIVYAAKKPHMQLRDPEIARNGIDVSSHTDLSMLIRGEENDDPSAQCDLFLQSAGNEKPRRIRVSGGLIFPSPDLFLSPDGKNLVLRTLAKEIDPIWRQYDDPVLQVVLARRIPPGDMLLVQQYEIVDIDAGTSALLIDAPVGYSGSDLMWSADSRSVIVSGVHLPLSEEATADNHNRRKNIFVAQVTLPERHVYEISTRKLKLSGWDPESGVVEFESEKDPSKADQSPGVARYQKMRDVWQEVEGRAPRPVTGDRRKILIEQSLNMPPRIVAENPASGLKSVLLDPNPDLELLSLGPVEEVSWLDGTGSTLKGALYLPPDYVPGSRYPLVIQTHGYDPREFWIDGPYSTAFAAQPLASKGIVVLQLAELGLGSTDEGEQNMRAFESAIGYLEKRGIIDRERVGIIGFSRTCYHVKYALTHSKFRFAAASIADGMDAGYFQYMVFANQNPNTAAEFELLLGGPPFGDGLDSWKRNSPGFLLQQVSTPVEIQSIGPASLLAQWEWFAGLSRLGKPVDQLYIPDGTHVLQKPWDRMASQQTNVDWFAFWLKGEEDPKPGKLPQYDRWRHLRKLQQASAGGPPPN